VSDLLEQGSVWLDEMRVAHVSRPVRYCRGSEALEILACIGKTLFEVDDGNGAVERHESRDFLISASALTLGLPQSSDRIRETQDGHVYVYEVMAPGKEPCWRWSDPYRLTLRIHTKQVS
jgi:hypothetical protein